MYIRVRRALRIERESLLPYLGFLLGMVWIVIVVYVNRKRKHENVSSV